jgi:hypothetical protein
MVLLPSVSRERWEKYLDVQDADLDQRHVGRTQPTSNVFFDDALMYSIL